MRSTAGYTALHLASNTGHTELVRFLVGAGANINIWNSRLQTALSLAQNDEIRNILREAKKQQGCAIQ